MEFRVSQAKKIFKEMAILETGIRRTKRRGHFKSGGEMGNRELICMEE